MIATEEWFWEGNIVRLLVQHLTNEGWSVHEVADTLSKAVGTDVIAERAGERLIVEVKGWPSTVYRDARRAGEFKATAPTNQAHQWFSHAVLKGMRMLASDPTAKTALAFPDFPRYRALATEIRPSLERLSLDIFFVAEDGSVQTLFACEEVACRTS